MSKRQYFVYIATNNNNTVLYTGVTNGLVRRMYEHRHKLVSSFGSKYNVVKLVYYESYQDSLEAIKREKQIKGGSRKKKLGLITSLNPNYEDLYPKII